MKRSEFLKRLGLGAVAAAIFPSLLKGEEHHKVATEFENILNDGHTSQWFSDEVQIKDGNVKAWIDKSGNGNHLVFKEGETT